MRKIKKWQVASSDKRVVFANLLQSLSNVSKKFRKEQYPYPNNSYEDDLKITGIDPLDLGRDAACKSFFETVLLGSLSHPIIDRR